MTVTGLESVTMHRLALAPFRADADTRIILESLRKALAVSYTHLDVYKRQSRCCGCSARP